MTELAFPIFNLVVLGSFLALAGVELMRHRWKAAPAKTRDRRR